jgi:hypothetical protein
MSGLLWQRCRMERKNRMRKGLIKAIVLVCVMLSTVLVMMGITQPSSADLTSEMEPALLPLVYMEPGGVRVNELYGYRGEMDLGAMRDTITPLAEDLSLPIVVKAYENAVESISYKVRTVEEGRLIEDGEEEAGETENGEFSFMLQFQNILEKGKEYMLLLTLVCDGEPVSYYTRIAQMEGCYMKESLDFVRDFHEQTFQEKQADGLATYLEPDGLEDNTTLQKVTIHSSLNQVCWADFEGERLEAPVPSIKEMGPHFNSIVQKYVLTSAGEHGEVEYYNVEEYYRLRYNSQNNRMYLLDYERTMNQIFRGEHGAAGKGRLQLGIRSDEVEYQANEKGDTLAFIQEGELWCYHKDSGRFSKVFSFRNPEGISSRENNDSHQIQIMKVSENGDIEFAVYGYMNRGAHEGQVGIGVFHYDNGGNSIEEKLFIPSAASYQMLKADWGSLFYVSDKDVFYLLAESKLYGIDLESGKAKELVGGLRQGSYAVSGGGRYLAWQDGGEKANRLKVMDLEGELERTIEGGQQEYLKPIGFVGSDFVYGVARKEDADTDAAGNGRFPMYKVIIQDKDANVVKDYHKEGFYVTKAYVEKDAIFLNREIKAEGGYLSVDQDTIKSQQPEAEEGIQVESFQSAQKQQQIQLAFSGGGEEEGKKTRVLVPREVVSKEPRTVQLDPGKAEGKYYVYHAGKIVLSTPSVSEAILTADTSRGVVIGQGTRTIWSRGRKTSQPAIGAEALDTEGLGEGSLARCLAYLLNAKGASLDVEGLLAQGRTPRQILAGAFSEENVMDLTGCTVEQVLYYVNMGTPVLAMVNQEALLIVGYDEHNTVLYDPALNGTKRMGLQDSSSLFGAAGNVFLGYIE